MKIGEIDISKVMVGSDEIAAIYAGLDLVYSSTPPTPPTPTDYSIQYLTLVPKSASTTFQFSQTGLSYSLDSGSTWTSLAASTNTPSVGVGDKIMFKGTITPTSYGIGTFSSSSDFDVEGNIMSLVYGDNFSGETSLSGKSYEFYSLFYQSSVVSAKNLVLPATTLAEGCYYSMFDSCSSLTVAPKLPATTLANYCYYGMFGFCTSLTTAPQLPSTTLADSCYFGMFFGCRSLTVAPQLPATTLASNCYYSMFESCWNLTEAPILSATTLVNYCYQNMFRSCSSLNSITCLATDISASNCTSNWVNGVAASGTFTKADEMSGWTTGNSGIPSNWTVQDYNPTPPTPVLPSGYTQVEYVETTGDSYVNLKIDPYSALTNSYTLETRLLSYTQSNFSYLISSEDAGASPYYGVGLRWDSGILQVFGGSDDTTVAQVNNGDGTSSFTFNCDSVTHTNNNIPFTLFCGYYNNEPWRYGKARFYSLSLTMNGNLERNLIPCKMDNDDVAGFYDTVYGVFYTALSGTPLTAGPTETIYPLEVFVENNS